MALPIYAKVSELKPNFPNPAACTALIYEYKRINHDKALDIALNILKTHPDNQWGQFLVAKNQKDPNQRVAKLKECFTKHPLFAKAANESGMVYGGALKNCNEAIEWYKKATEIAPGYAACYNNIGVNY